jgi:hypothetical protein
LPRDKKLLARLIRLGVFGQLALAALLFGSAGSFDFWQAWAFMGVTLAATIWTCIYFYKRDPQLLERRMLRKEKLGAQKLIIALWKTLGAVSFLLAGCDHRVDWSRAHLAPAPLWLELLALAGVAHVNGRSWLGWPLLFDTGPEWIWAMGPLRARSLRRSPSRSKWRANRTTHLASLGWSLALPVRVFAAI